MFGWDFFGSDISTSSLQAARTNISSNSLEDHIELFLSKDSNSFQDMLFPTVAASVAELNASDGKMHSGCTLLDAAQSDHPVGVGPLGAFIESFACTPRLDASSSSQRAFPNSAAHCAAYAAASILPFAPGKPACAVSSDSDGRSAQVERSSPSWLFYQFVKEMRALMVNKKKNQESIYGHDGANGEGVLGSPSWVMGCMANPPFFEEHEMVRARLQTGLIDCHGLLLLCFRTAAAAAAASVGYERHGTRQLLLL
jgi:hypothetical protein